MIFNIGMRIPPKIGAEGIEKVALWAAQVGLNTLDVPRLTPEVKGACQKAGIEIGSVDAGSGARLLSRDEKRQANAVEALKMQMTEISQLG
jgi:sugar phosphate isomerase/epimerase